MHRIVICTVQRRLGGSLSTESKRREVLQLLKEWRSFHSPYGGAFALEDATLKDASYGPAACIETGAAYPKGQRAGLRKSYRLLDAAIELEKRTAEGMAAWLLLLGPYFGDPGDPDIVRRWREVGDERIGWHDWFVDRLAGRLAHKDLYVVWPARMSTRQEKQIEKRHNEFYEEYQQIKAEKLKEGMSQRKANKKAVDTASARCGLSLRRGYEIVQVREGRKAG